VLDRFLWHTTKQHEKDSTLDLVVTVDSGKKTLDQVVIKIDVLRHVVDSIPVLFRHLVLDLDSCHFFLMEVFAAKLNAGKILDKKGIQIFNRFYHGVALHNTTCEEG